jgi:hypothetical protein
MARQLLMGYCLVIIEASQTHSDIPHSVGLLWTGDRPVTETSTWQHTTLTTEKNTPCGFRIRNPGKREAENPRLRPRGPRVILTSYNLTIIALILSNLLQCK